MKDTEAELPVTTGGALAALARKSRGKGGEIVMAKKKAPKEREDHRSQGLRTESFLLSRP